MSLTLHRELLPLLETDRLVFVSCGVNIDQISPNEEVGFNESYSNWTDKTSFVKFEMKDWLSCNRYLLGRWYRRAFAHACAMWAKDHSTFDTGDHVP